jgi:predicted ATPase/DNA-binding CsgD family transcriptional regulator
VPDATRPSRTNRGNERARLVALPGGQGGLNRTSIPSDLSSFVGREHELGEVVSLLRDHRLVSLIGAGGSGKTRLATAVAREMIDIFAGPWVVPLAPVSDPEQVPRAVGAAVGIGERPAQPMTDTLAEVLRDRSALLVLDNCEHLIEPCAALAEALLRGSSELKILVTSREVLGIPGEVAWPVPPLQEAMRLFTERAQEVRPSFALTEQNTPVVAQIAERLDGLPLAIELAAARIRVLSVTEIADRLDNALRLLVGERGTPSRHRSLEATFDWGHDLLSAAERVLFRRLSIFRGGFTLGAAEAICADAELPTGEVLEVLSLLVDKSLVIADHTDGTTRYRLLEVVRQYADERRLAAGEADAALPARHAAYFTALAADAALRYSGADEGLSFDRLASEHDNLRAALTWLVGQADDGPAAAELAAALWPFWFARGFPVEGIGWLQSAIGQARPEDREARAKALNGLVILAVFQEDYDLAWASGQECLALYRTLDDPDGIAASLTALSTTAVAGQRSDVDVAGMIAEARSLEARLRDRRVRAYLRDIEGVLALQSGDPFLAIDYWQEALALHRKIDNVLGAAFVLANLGLLCARLGDRDRSAGWLVEGLRLSRDLGYKLIIQYCLIGLGRLAAETDRLERAARLWGAADAMTEAYGAHLTRASREMIDYEHQLDAARQRLDPRRWTAAWSAGRGLTADQAVAYALDEDHSDPIPPDQRHPNGLTDREVDVLRLVAAGLTSVDVGRRLFLSPRTVDWHLSSIYAKLGVRSRTEAARFAITHGLS